MLRLFALALGELWRKRVWFPCTVGGVTYAPKNEGSLYSPSWVAFKGGLPVEAVRAPYGTTLTRGQAKIMLKLGRYGRREHEVQFDELLPASPVPAEGSLPCRAPIRRRDGRRTLCGCFPTMTVDARGYLAECTGCGCAAGYGKTPGDALSKWNHWVLNPPEED